MHQYTLQNHQKFLKRLLATVISAIKVLFVLWNTGAGKTDGILQMMEFYINQINSKTLGGVKKGKVFVISNKGAKKNFIDAIISKPGNVANDMEEDIENSYITKEEIKKLSDLREKANSEESIRRFRKIKKDYITARLKDAGYSFHTFQSFGRESIFEKIKNFDDSLVIVDEAHTLLHKNLYYQAFNTLRSRSKNMKLVLLTATPMFNEPEDIVSFTNLMYPEPEQINRSLLFDGKNILKEGWQDIIIDKYKGKVSYITVFDPETYPQRIDIGKIPDGLLEYTKIIQVPMSEIQYKSYKDHYHGVITDELKKIINFCMPGKYMDDNGNEKYGRFRMDQISEQEYESLGISKFISPLYGERYTGKFLTQKEIGKYSAKYAKCLENIIDNPHGQVFVYSSKVQNTGTKLLTEMFRINGFDEYGSSVIGSESRYYKTNEPYWLWKKNPKNKDKTFISAKFVLFHDKLSDDNRDRIIDLFNSPENIDGSRIKIIIGSQLLKESVNLKRVRYVDIIEYQENFSKLEQIIGRAMRYRSHIDLPESERNVYIRRYVVSLPESSITFINNEGIMEKSKWSVEELEYQKDEKNHIVIKKIERMIKMIALDCNKNHDKFPKSQYNNTRECDYMDCDYECLFDDYDFKNIYKDIPEDIYSIFYWKQEVSNIITIIKKIFYNNIIYQDRYLINHIMQNYSIDNQQYIKEALDEMVDKKLKFKNKYGFYSYLQYVDSLYASYPYDLIADDFDSLSMNMRGPGFIHIPKTKAPINIIISELIQSPDKNNKAIKIKNILEKIKTDITYINSLDIQSQIQLLEYAILNRVETILIHYKYYLIEPESIKACPFLLNSNFNTDNISDKVFTGHTLGTVPHILIDGKFVNRSISGILPNIKAPENDFIVGISTKRASGLLDFKLRYTKNTEHDKRFASRGFKCNQINDKKELNDIYNKLTGQTTWFKNIKEYCEAIEAAIRKKQYENPTIRWFYEIHQ